MTISNNCNIFFWELQRFERVFRQVLCANNLWTNKKLFAKKKREIRKVCLPFLKIGEVRLQTWLWWLPNKIRIFRWRRPLHNPAGFGFLAGYKMSLPSTGHKQRAGLSSQSSSSFETRSLHKNGNLQNYTYRFIQLR